MSDSQSPFEGLAEKIRGGKSPSTSEFESRKPQLVITRNADEAQGSGWKNRIILSYRNRIASSKYMIFVDGDRVGEIKNGERVTIEVEPGLRKVHLECGNTKSRRYEIELENGDRLKLKCCAKLTGIALYR